MCSDSSETTSDWSDGTAAPRGGRARPGSRVGAHATSGGAASPLSSASSSRRAFAASRSLMSRTAVDHGPHHPSPRSSAVSACPPIRNPCIRGSRAGGAGGAAGGRRRPSLSSSSFGCIASRAASHASRADGFSAALDDDAALVDDDAPPPPPPRGARLGAAGFLPSAFDIGAAAFALPLPLGGGGGASSSAAAEEEAAAAAGFLLLRAAGFLAFSLSPSKSPKSAGFGRLRLVTGSAECAFRLPASHHRGSPPASGCTWNHSRPSGSTRMSTTSASACFFAPSTRACTRQ